MGGAPRAGQKRGASQAELQQLKRELRQQTRDLPVAEAEDDLVRLVEQNQVVVLIGETGSGKTTQVPQFLHHRLFKGRGVVGVTQPRRIAAVTVARRVAQEYGCELGDTVGYAVRFDDKTSHRTQIKYMTDGLLLRELVTEPELRTYSCIVLDEAHERSINSDVLLGLLKALVDSKRPDLKVVVMSATLNAEQFSSFWGGCPIGYVEGRAYPVEVHYTQEPVLNIVDGAVTTVLQVHVDHPNDTGDILVFLTGQDRIEDCARLLNDKADLLPPGAPGLLVVPLYANLPPEKQARAFVPPPAGKRKVILATNVAETSLTIPNIRFVVDCGMVKEKQYNARTGMDSLREVPVSQAQAKQRAGRAGRVQAGKCYRMFTEEGYLQLAPSTQPEIKRVDLSSVVLQLKQLGVGDPRAFHFVDPPRLDHLVNAMELLYLLGALDRKGNLTREGDAVGRYPLLPTLGKVLLQAERLGVFREVACIVSMLTVENVLASPAADQRAAVDKKRAAFASPHGDHLTLLNIFTEFRKQKPGERADWCKRAHVNYRKILQVADTQKQLADVHRMVMAHAQRSGVDVSAQPPAPDADGADGAEAEPAPAAAALTDRTVPIRKAFCYGFFLKVATYDVDKKVYVTPGAKTEVALHPTSVMFKQRQRPALLLYNELVSTSKRYLRDVVAVEEDWLVEAAPAKWKRKGAHAS